MENTLPLNAPVTLDPAILVAIFSFWRMRRSRLLKKLLQDFITWNIYNSSTPSHLPKGKNRPCKQAFSVVLMAVCDAHYVFTLVNVGDFGSNNDSGVLENSTMGKAFASNQMGLPDEQHVKGCKIPLPYFLVGDDILALKSCFLRSFPRQSKLSEDQQIFNYHLS